MRIVLEKLKHIAAELKGHLPFTLFGALIGLLFIVIFGNMRNTFGDRLFSIFHPAHVLLSAMVTASMFSLHTKRKRYLLVLLVGIVGSVGVATLSDVVIPHAGSALFGLHLPSHSELHGCSHDDHNHEKQHEHHNNNACEHDHDHSCSREGHIHLGFVDEWYLVFPAAILGVLICYVIPRTKFPHAMHVLISTWASSSYLLMKIGADLTFVVGAEIVLILFLSVWLPCCVSDIVFPLLFVKSDLVIEGTCPMHGAHSHGHKHAEPNETTGNE